MARVLLAEDDGAMLDMVQRALTGDGHTVVATHDGQEALDALNGGASFDVMLTDIHMPSVDGISLAKAAVQKLPKLKIVLMSAYTDTAIPDAVKGNISEVLSKPLALDKVRAAVKKAAG